MIFWNLATSHKDMESVYPLLQFGWDFDHFFSQTQNDRLAQNGMWLPPDLHVWTLLSLLTALGSQLSCYEEAEITWGDPHRLSDWEFQHHLAEWVKSISDDSGSQLADFLADAIDGRVSTSPLLTFWIRQFSVVCVQGWPMPLRMLPVSLASTFMH